MQGGTRSLWFHLAPCIRSAKESLWWNCHSSKAFFLTVGAVWQQGEEFGERYEGEGTCAASPLELCWLASVLRIFGGGHGVPVERGCGSTAHTNHPHLTTHRRTHGHGHKAVCSPAHWPANDQLNSRSMWLHGSRQPSAPYKASTTTRPRLQCRPHSTSAESKRSAQQLLNVVP